MPFKKDLAIHIISFILVFFFIGLLRSYFKVFYIPFFLGGLLGTILPDLDHFLYIYLMKPQELTSLRTQSLVNRGQLWKTLDLISLTRGERRNLIFHSAFFQIMFWVLTFFVFSSNSNLFGRGLVLAFSLHLAIDQMIDLLSLNNLDNWFSNNFVPMEFGKILTKNALTLYFLGSVVLVFGIGLLM